MKYGSYMFKSGDYRKYQNLHSLMVSFISYQLLINDTTMLFTVKSMDLFVTFEMFLEKKPKKDIFVPF